MILSRRPSSTSWLMSKYCPLETFMWNPVNSRDLDSLSLFENSSSLSFLIRRRSHTPLKFVLVDRSAFATDYSTSRYDSSIPSCSEDIGLNCRVKRAKAKLLNYLLHAEVKRTSLSSCDGTVGSHTSVDRSAGCTLSVELSTMTTAMTHPLL